MTAQIPERLLYEGVERDMFTEPLESFFEMGGERPQWPSECSALWRGYLGSWRVVDGRLYLIGLSGMFEDAPPVHLEQVFPSYSNGVFAHWFSGAVRLPQGERLSCVHMGFGSTYERDEFLIFERGVLKRKLFRENGLGAFAWSDNSPECVTRADLDESEDDEDHFVVKRRHLVQRMTVAEIEEIELVNDPLGAAPKLPFGHLNEVWKRFLSERTNGSQLWAFQARRQNFGAVDCVEGYAEVNDGIPGRFTLSYISS